MGNANTGSRAALPSIRSVSQWNWVARRIDHGTGPVRTSSSAVCLTRMYGMRARSTPTMDT